MVRFLSLSPPCCKILAAFLTVLKSTSLFLQKCDCAKRRAAASRAVSQLQNAGIMTSWCEKIEELWGQNCFWNPLFLNKRKWAVLEVEVFVVMVGLQAQAPVLLRRTHKIPPRNDGDLLERQPHVVRSTARTGDLQLRNAQRLCKRPVESPHWEKLMFFVSLSLVKFRGKNSEKPPRKRL